MEKPVTISRSKVSKSISDKSDPEVANRNLVRVLWTVCEGYRGVNDLGQRNFVEFFGSLVEEKYSGVSTHKKLPFAQAQRRVWNSSKLQLTQGTLGTSVLNDYHPNFHVWLLICATLK
nr:unnamed protein product [Haemonchus contortus]